jgi:circadian clock protein KaiC
MGVTSLERLGTGDPAFDRILGGGLPVRSVTVLAGQPGAGKTVLALQMLFHLARQGKKGLYVTTLSEPAIKLARYAQEFAFFDASLIGNQIELADIGSTLHEHGAEKALAQLGERVAATEPDLVVVDSFKAALEFATNGVGSRSLAYHLAVELATWGATTLLVGEYAGDDISDRPEFAIADGIIRLGVEREGLTAPRTLEILKMRGAEIVSGRHFLEIGTGGVEIYPRVRAPESAGGPRLLVGDRLSTGVSGLDDLTRGGLPRGSSTLIEGGTGTGKTLLGLHFLLAGAAAGEPGILLTLEETADQVCDVAAGYGFDLPALEATGLIEIEYASPVELSTDRFLNHARQRVEATGARRVVLDSLTGLAMGVPSDRRFRELVYAMAKHLRHAGATLLMTLEVSTLLGSPTLTGQGVLSSADNIFLLRYVELNGRLERAVSVLKARGVAHSTELRHAMIDSTGFNVGAPFTDLRGVLTGLPVPVS